MDTMTMNNGFFPTVSDQIRSGHFYIIQQKVLHIDEDTKRFQNTCVLSEDSVDRDGHMLRAGKDVFTLENYIDDLAGSKFLFLDEDRPDHRTWAQSQDHVSVWFVMKNTIGIVPPKGVEILVAGQIFKDTYQILTPLCCITIAEGYLYMTHVPLSSPKSWVQVNGHMAKGLDIPLQ